MLYAIEQLEHLCGSIKKYVTPCFPPYYCVYDNIKKVYMDFICGFLKEHHLDNNDVLEVYMQEEPLKSEILLTVYEFIQKSQDILQEPSNPQLFELTQLMQRYMPTFLAHSEEAFT